MCVKNGQSQRAAGLFMGGVPSHRYRIVRPLGLLAPLCVNVCAEEGMVDFSKFQRQT